MYTERKENWIEKFLIEAGHVLWYKFLGGEVEMKKEWRIVVTSAKNANSSDKGEIYNNKMIFD